MEYAFWTLFFAGCTYVSMPTKEIELTTVYSCLMGMSFMRFWSESFSTKEKQ